MGFVSSFQVFLMSTLHIQSGGNEKKPKKKPSSLNHLHTNVCKALFKLYLLWNYTVVIISLAILHKLSLLANVYNENKIPAFL